MSGLARTLNQARRVVFGSRSDLNFKNVKVKSTIVLEEGKAVNKVFKVLEKNLCLFEDVFLVISYFFRSFKFSPCRQASADENFVNKCLTFFLFRALFQSFFVLKPLDNEGNECKEAYNNAGKIVEVNDGEGRKKGSKNLILRRNFAGRCLVVKVRMKLKSNNALNEVLNEVLNEARTNINVSNNKKVVKAVVSNVTKVLKVLKVLKLPKVLKVLKIANEVNTMLFPSRQPVFECSNDAGLTDRLSQSGDVESNPGPAPRPDTSTNPTGANKSTRSQLQVVTQNVRGLNDKKKVRHLINACYKLSRQAVDNIFFFQETYVSRLDLLNFLWRGEHHTTMGTGNSLGCITLVTAPYKIIHSVEINQRGHVLVLSKDDLNSVDLIAVNVYAPNGSGPEKLRFFEELVDIIRDTSANYRCDNIVLAGDLNLVFNENEVKNRAFNPTEKRTADAVHELLEELQLVDGWDVAAKRCYTWTTNRYGQQSFSTLDRILFRSSSLRFLNKTVNWSLSISDHAAVIATFEKNEVKKGRSALISRLDPRILSDPEAIRVMDETFGELFQQRSHSWNPHVSLEYCKMCIRSAANLATGSIKAKYRDDEQSLNVDINAVVEELSDSRISDARKDLLRHKLDDLRLLKRKLVEKIGAKLESRTAKQWYNEGELSNKYFFNLLNRKINDDITSIKNDAGEVITDPTIIESEIRKFYKNLYESVPGNVEINDVFRNVDPVRPGTAEALCEPMTMQELEVTLKNCTDSSPGPDGIPYSFLKHFWPSIGQILLDCWNYSLLTNQLPHSHKESYLRLIPKAGKDSKVIGNLRPITLSNTDHKLITKAYAKRLTDLVEDRISEVQTAYIKGRLINDNIRSMLMTIDLANDDNDVDGVVVSLDAKKAFDSVDHRYIKRCLEAFGLSRFVPIFNTLYKDLSSKIIINGQPVEGYKILKGVKQGDALSCIIFVLCMEPLLRNLNANDEIERISYERLDLTFPKSFGYADDVTIVTKNNARCVREIFVEYEAFTKASGLILNADKTEILSFNRQRRTGDALAVEYLNRNYNLTTVGQIKINGILFLQGEKEREDINVQKVIDAMERHLTVWSKKHLTLIGRILVIKTFAMSQAIFLMQSMSLSEGSVRRMMALIYKFLWNKNLNVARAPERISRSIMLTPVKFGGFGLIDLKDVGRALDLRAYGRLLNSQHPFFVQIKRLLLPNEVLNIKVNGVVDGKLKSAIKYLNEDRKLILKWSPDQIVSNVQLREVLMGSKVRDLLTPAGRLSLNFFVLSRTIPNPKLNQLNMLQFNSISKFLPSQNLVQAVQRLVGTNPLNVVNVIGNLNLYPTRPGVMVDIAGLSSKEFRTARSKDEELMINVFKLGPILTPGELAAWTKSVKKLTSTRHRNILLRAMHGDIYSNSRLHKFKLRDAPNCCNCPELVETRLHRLVECPKAIEAWNELNRIKASLSLNTLSDNSIENVVGAKDRVSKLELALQAELILKLSTKSDGYCPSQLVRSAVLLVCNSEKLEPEVNERFKAFKNR